ncbi:SDR family NAD(P)-dependent oxidoreductase [Streptomyces sp. NPDC048211]|uniref:SDR family NAD(P)-dependent oxidoreductase n=1 Tax=Streptomyces sp. NPDC048211 TaxID=3365516 RepID=UPI003717CB99
MTSLGEAWAGGVDIDWTALLPQAHPTDLPTYAFQRRRYWLDPSSNSAPAGDDDAAFWDAVENTDPDRLADTLSLPADAPLTAVLPALVDWRQRSRAARTVDDWRYRITWKRQPEPAEPATLTGPWIVALAARHREHPLTRAALDAMEHAGAHVVELELTDADADRDRLTERLRKAVADCGTAPTGVLSLLALDEERHRDHPAMPSGTATTLSLIRALGSAEINAPLWLATTEVVTTHQGEHPRHPLQSLIWGLGQVTALEHADRWGGLIDLPSTPDDRTGPRLCAALAAHSDEDQLAVRPSGTLVRRLAHAGTDDRPAARTWRPRGTVVVTGGTGALGVVLARWLAAQGAEHLVLTGRRGADAPGAAELRDELAATGVRVTLAACDTADRDAVRRLLTQLAADGDTVRAVLHAAGVADLTSIEDTGPGAFAAGLAAKVDGALNLTDLLDHRELDAFILFSSIAGVWGSGDHAAYAAANAHLNALAEANRARGIPTLCVAWGVWNAFGAPGSGGISEAIDTDQLHRRGLPMIDPELGLTALQRALDRDETLLTVAPVAWNRFFPLFSAARPRPLFDDLPQVRTLTETVPGTPAGATATAGPSGTRAAELAALPEADRDSALLALVRAEAATVLGFERSEDLEPDRAFRDVGFDSLTAMELRNRLGAVSGLTLPASLVFDHPTPNAVARHLKTGLFGHDEADAGSVLGELDHLAGRLDGLTPDGNTRLEVTLRLRSLLTRWTDDGAPENNEQPPNDLQSASVDEVLAFIDNELGS